MTDQNSGLFITEGMNVKISDFAISISENGELNSKITFQTGLDMAPYWLDIAFTHLIATEACHVKIQESLKIKEERQIGEQLRMEFLNGMQTIMSSCISIDAYYATIKGFAKIPEEVQKSWRENGTARYKQIAETLKSVFSIPQSNFLQIREILKQCFEIRDKAVHPKAGTDLPVLHPEAKITSDWRFSLFRFVNAKAVMKNVLNIMNYTFLLSTQSKNEILVRVCEKHKIDIKKIVSMFEEKYGNLN